MHQKLNLGSGRKQMSDAVNLDLVHGTRPDVVHDLNMRPWPLPHEHFTEVYAHDVIEHLNSVVLRLANRWPERYERRWAWLFPAWFLFVELEVIKPERIAGPIKDDDT